MEKISLDNLIDFLNKFRENNIDPKKLGLYYCNEFQIIDFGLAHCENPNFCVTEIATLYLEY